MAKVETEDIIEKVESKEEDITLTEEDKKNAELLSLETIEKDLSTNKSELKKNNLFIIIIIGIIAAFIYLLPYIAK